MHRCVWSRNVGIGSRGWNVQSWTGLVESDFRILSAVLVSILADLAKVSMWLEMLWEEIGLVGAKGG